MKKLLTLDNVFFISVFASLALLVIPIFSTTIRATSDGFAHKFRAASFIKSIREGNIRPRWLSDQAFGYGTPTLIYNFSLPYYAVAGINIFANSVEKSSQIYAAIIILTTFISMYLFTRKLYGKKVGLLTAIAYIGTPTFVYCIYGLEGWGQMSAFIFPPLILYEALLLKEKITLQRAVIFVVTWVLFINTHNVSALLSILPIAVILLVLMGKIHRTLLYIFQLFISAGIISGFLWLPSLVLSNWIKYGDLVTYHASIRQNDLTKIQNYIAISINTLTTGITSFYTDTPGLIIFMVLVISLMLFLTILYRKIVLHKNSNEGKLIYPAVLFLLTFISLIMTTDLTLPIWKTGIFDFLLLYPSRFMFIVPFTGTLLLGWMINKITNTWVYLVVCLLILILARPFTNPIFQFTFDDHYFERSVQLIDWASGTRMSMGTVEFLPKWMDADYIRLQQNLYFQTNTIPGKIEIDPAIGTLLDQRISSERMLFHIHMKADADVVLNTSYYPDWMATINGKSVPINRDMYGRIRINVPRGDALLSVRFGYSVIEQWSYILSIFGLIYLFTLLHKLHR